MGANIFMILLVVGWCRSFGKRFFNEDKSDELK